MTSRDPEYFKTYKDGLLKERSLKLQAGLESCDLCPRECSVDRLSGETGVCKTGKLAWESSYAPHFGEERPLVGYYGSGTIFFTHCNLLCNFCQNYDISHEGQGYEIGSDQLATMMLKLQKMGCHNINFVTPTHVVPQIVAALEIAIEKGLEIPLVYNSGGYDKVETLRLLEGIFDIYMPDLKFFDRAFAKKTCNAPDYPEIAREAIKEMHRQVGDLIINSNGIARKGLLIRHLVMPGNLEDTRKILHFISTEISKNTYVNIMPQYRPCGEAYQFEEISRSLSQNEFLEAIRIAHEEGLIRIDV